MIHDSEASYRAVIFDLDGVLIDSRSVIEKAWCTVAAEYGRELSPADREEQIHGRTGAQTVKYIFADLPETKQTELWRRVDQIEETANYNEITGACAFINALHASGVTLGLVTSSWHPKIGNALSNLGIAEKFHSTVSRDDVERGKPAPDPYLKCAKWLHETPENILVFEDSISGVESAVAAGSTCIGIGNDDLLISGAHSTIKDFGSLKVHQTKHQDIRLSGLSATVRLTTRS